MEEEEEEEEEVVVVVVVHAERCSFDRLYQRCVQD